MKGWSYFLNSCISTQGWVHGVFTNAFSQISALTISWTEKLRRQPLNNTSIVLKKKKSQEQYQK